MSLSTLYRSYHDGQLEGQKKPAHTVFSGFKHLNASEQNLNQEDQVETKKYYELKNQWESLQRDKINGTILRSKAKFVEEGEKNTKYFLNLEKRNYKKCMKAMI